MNQNHNPGLQQYGADFPAIVVQSLATLAYSRRAVDSRHLQIDGAVVELALAPPGSACVSFLVFGPVALPKRTRDKNTRFVSSHVPI